MRPTKLVLSFVLLTLLQTIGTAQQFEYKAVESSQLWFDGTSTLHDFTCHAEALEANVTFSPALLDGGPGEIEKGHVIIPVKKIKHENDGLTQNMYKTLEPEKWPEILFDLNKIEITDSTNTFKTVQANIQGSLTLKGETREISVPISVSGLENADTLQVKGNYPLSLSNFDIKRPTFFLGTLKVGEKIDIFFDLKFIRTNQYIELTKQ
ncbi:YceI family protein [candidate division KSB1 bacterium]|nr:YceI family protein [candidate division KSB1 bacterium]